MDIHSLYQVFLPYFRGKRLKLFFEKLRPTSSTLLLDVGGYPWVWEQRGFPGSIVHSNLSFPKDIAKAYPQDLLVIADGMKLPFQDSSISLVFSNSVIEHLQNAANQERFASELRRVGKDLWIQTPARWFLIEPHLMTPFIHFFPKKIQRRLMRYFSVWGIVKKPTQKEIDDFLDEVRLLTYADMCKLFPDCEILRERFFGITKSFIAVRKLTP